MKAPGVSGTPGWKALEDHAASEIQGTHLKDLLQSEARNDHLAVEFEDILLDYSRQRVTPKTMLLLHELATQQDLAGKIQAMAEGKHINKTEDRAVLHIALRAAPCDFYANDGKNVVPEVIAVRNQIKEFSHKVRSSAALGHTGKAITDVISVGIGGSYLGAEFVYEALRHERVAKQAAKGRRLRFLANVDPVAVARATEGLNPATTMVIIISKTFTTVETMLNARTLRKWIVDALGEAAIAKHIVAVSTNIKACREFGIQQDNVFAFWDWVGGRYSVTSAVGLLPLSLHYGFDIVQSFLDGARSVDQHFLKAPAQRNIPIILGLLGIWNSSFLKYPVRALLPYSEALCRFVAHIQQVDMESNGKRVTVDGSVLSFATGEVDFGEPGTNGQHSFYQLLHQGQVIPADFIGFVRSQHPVDLPGDAVPNHDELMAAFFSQPDALAIGKQDEQLQQENVPVALMPHKYFPGNRPSSSLLLPELTAYTTGQLLAIYEHRTAVQGFIWDVNSFDQWGVELGKQLGSKVRDQLKDSRRSKSANIHPSFNSSTKNMLLRYLANS
ncbi:Glucose-6-phosphate isomerase [Plasmodiophora brassicae]